VPRTGPVSNRSAVVDARGSVSGRPAVVLLVSSGTSAVAAIALAGL
jgi:hypothetical protein